ncbi:MAG TPA: DUF2917 domain-containing protein [Burkholderiaceae bacterium]
MNNELRHPLTDLTAGSILRVRDGQGRAIVVFEGRVWITLEDDPRDIVLDAGESFSVDRQGLTLVQACRDSKLILAHGDAGTPALSADELHQWAHTQRSQAIGDALAASVTALQRAVASALATASMLISPRRPAPCTTVR